MGIQGNALSAGCRDIRIASPHVSPDIPEAAYRSGTLHVVTVAPRKDYATRIRGSGPRAVFPLGRHRSYLQEPEVKVLVYSA
eukprot:2405039-Pyramimonas_sp.AAC.1